MRKPETRRDMSRVLAVGGPTLLFLFIVLTLTPGVFMTLSFFDSGFLASGAMEILRGGLPMRDFFVIYGPGQYYLTAGAMALFGEDLAVLNALHLLAMAGLGTLLAVLAARLCPRTPRVAMCWAGVMFTAFALCFPPSPGYAAITGTLLLLLALAQLVRPGQGASTGALLRASLLIGIAGLVRWDFGVLGFAALALTWLAGRPADSGPGLARLTLPGLVLGLAFFLPFVGLSGWERWWAEVPVFHLREFREWRGISFVQPNLAFLLGAANFWIFLAALSRWIAFSLPFVLIALGLPTALWRLFKNRGGDDRFRDQLALGLSLLSLVLLNQQRVRTGIEQGFPALVVALPIATYLPGAWAASVRRVAWLLPATVALVMAYEAQQTWSEQLDTRVVNLPRYSGWRVNDQPQALRRALAYGQIVQTLREQTPGGQRIFSGVVDTSRLFVNDPMLYFLTDRRAATRWIEMEPGLVNAPQRQAGVVEELERYAPPRVVLLKMRSNEANRTAYSNGPSLIDQYVSEHYEKSEAIGIYEIWKRR